MLIGFIITLIFLGIIYKFLNQNKILLLNFIFYVIFLWILLFQRALFNYTEIISETSKWIKINEYLLILTLSVLIISIWYILLRFFWKLKKYLWEQCIIWIYLILWFSFFTIFHIFNIFTWNEWEFLLKVYSDTDIVYSIIWFIIFALNLLYLFWYLWDKLFLQKKKSFKVNLKKIKSKNIFWKIKYILRDIVIITFFVLIYIVVVDLNTLYGKYYNRYKNPDNFTEQVYICEDSTKLILEQNYEHHPIINPHDSFIDFYQYYGESHWPFEYEINVLHPDKINKKYLGKCISQNWNDYFGDYMEKHGDEPRIRLNNYLY